jgi:hypothetical protein
MTGRELILLLASAAALRSPPSPALTLSDGAVATYVQSTWGLRGTFPCQAYRRPSQAPSWLCTCAGDCLHRRAAKPASADAVPSTNATTRRAQP